MTILSDLKAWRMERAAKEGVEPFRVLPNATIEAIVNRSPGTLDELMEVKGIKDAKARKYGAAILELVNKSRPALAEEPLPGHRSERRAVNRKSREENIVDPDVTSSGELTVSAFLDGVNLELSGIAARVRGEVSSVDERERVVYFSLKDADDGSTLPCLIFRSAYVVAGVRLSVGDEVIVEGVPEIWKPMGKLSFKCGFIEYAGEGALKKAYDALLAKLTSEGLLALERKREISPFATRIALLTSRDGAAIGDFMMNVGRHGYRIELFASSVEGARAVPELLSGLRYFRKHAERYDVLVVVRGGGSLESLSAFNNETLVREVASFPIPVVAGIGHEKDITLATLVADAGVSTPTAASRLVRQSWEDGAEQVALAEHRIGNVFTGGLSAAKEHLGALDESILGYFQTMKELIRTLLDRFLAKRESVSAAIRSGVVVVSAMEDGLVKGKNKILSDQVVRLAGLEKLLRQFDPARVLQLGYCLARLSSGKLLRLSKDATVGDMIDIRLSEGGIAAEVRKVMS